jgi:hypothetical protein
MLPPLKTLDHDVGGEMSSKFSTPFHETGAEFLKFAAAAAATAAAGS